MRLLDTETYELHSFLDPVPPYAILSHVWGEEEVTFDLISDEERRVKRKGWLKVECCCRRAWDDGWRWLWMDTCCINKADTTELGEAINSMFRYYEAAEICYAYLADVFPKYALSDGPDPYNQCSRTVDPECHNAIPWVWGFRASRWFTRGWTLQELLAPRFLLFLDREWGDIGSRERMAVEVQNVTGIEVRYLYDFKASSVATKMSWAANRHTTREEDRAYSLLGLFDINMSLIYGEGKRAFVRLQKELIQNQNDESILAWGEKSQSGSIFNNTRALGALATSPEAFEHCTDVAPWHFDKSRRTFSSTNIGIRLNAEVFEHWDRTWTSIDDEHVGRWIYTIRLNCRQNWPLSESTRSPLVLILETNDSEKTVFQRLNRSLRSWRELETVEWKTLGRKDIFLTLDDPFTTTSTNSTPTEECTIHLDYPVVMERRFTWTFSIVKNLQGSEAWTDGAVDTPAISRSSNTRMVIMSLRKDTAICRSFVVTHVDWPETSIWLIIRPGSRQPYFGIWSSDPNAESYTTMERLSSGPVHKYPHAAALMNDNAYVELAVTPMPRDSQTDHREYSVTLSLTQKKPYNGVVGRLTWRTDAQNLERNSSYPLDGYEVWTECLNVE